MPVEKADLLRGYKDTKFFRGGRSSHRISLVKQDYFGSRWFFDEEKNSIGMRFFMPSKGGGETRIRIDIGNEDFRDILISCSENDSDFGVILLECLAHWFKSHSSKEKLTTEEKKDLLYSLATSNEISTELYEKLIRVL